MIHTRPLTEAMGIQLIAALLLAIFQTAAVALAPDADPWPALSPLFAAQAVCIIGAGVAFVGLVKSRSDDEGAERWAARIIARMPAIMLAAIVVVVAAWALRSGGAGLTALVWGLVAGQAAFAPAFARRRLERTDAA